MKQYAYSFVVDINIDDVALTSKELAAIKQYVSTRAAIRKAIENSIDVDDPALVEIDPMRSIKVKVS